MLANQALVHAAHFFEETGLEFIIENLPASSYEDNIRCFDSVFSKSSQLIDAYIVEGELLDCVQTELLDNHRANGNIITLKLVKSGDPPQLSDPSLETISKNGLGRFPILSGIKKMFNGFWEPMRKRLDVIKNKNRKSCQPRKFARSRKPDRLSGKWRTESISKTENEFRDTNNHTVRRLLCHCRKK